jgi:hypothetical protein
MNTYDVYFRSDLQWGMREFVADTPEKGLELTRGTLPTKRAATAPLQAPSTTHTNGESCSRQSPTGRCRPAARAATMVTSSDRQGKTPVSQSAWPVGS